MIKINKIKPMFNSILTTMDKYDTNQTKDGLVDVEKETGAVKELQTVLEVGDAVRDVKIGDVVCVNPERFAVHMHKNGSLKDNVITDNPVVYYNFPIIEVGGKERLLITDRDISFIVEEFQEEPEDDIIK